MNADIGEDEINLVHDLLIRVVNDPEPCSLEDRVAGLVAASIVRSAVDFSIHLDHKPGAQTNEIPDEVPDRMLAPESPVYALASQVVP
jgi:hypothetical protein